MEKERKKQLYIAMGVLIIGIIGLFWGYHNLNRNACNPSLELQNLTYPVSFDFGFNRIEIGCDTISIGDGNFDYYGINEFVVGGIMLTGFVFVYFLFREKEEKESRWKFQIK